MGPRGTPFSFGRAFGSVCGNKDLAVKRPVSQFGRHIWVMPRQSTKSRTKKPAPAHDLLKGWQQIASFLGQPVSVVQRWANEGMPVTREGRFVATSPTELNQWLGRESGEPVHVATAETDLSDELKRGLAYVRRERPERKRSGR